MDSESSASFSRLEGKIAELGNKSKFSSALPGMDYAILFSYSRQKYTAAKKAPEIEDGLAIYNTENSHLSFIPPPYNIEKPLSYGERFRRDAQAIRNDYFKTPIVIYEGEPVTAISNSGFSFTLKAPDFSYDKLGEMLRTCYLPQAEEKGQEDN